jgi:hypothetical protein
MTHQSGSAIVEWTLSVQLRRTSLKSEETSCLRHPLDDVEWRRIFGAVSQTVRNAGEPGFRVIAEHIAGLILLLDPLMTSYCQRTCPTCLDPCCNGRKVFFNLTDVVYLAGRGKGAVPGQTRSQAGLPCRYLSREGCRLSRLLRPYVCTWFLCEAQMALLQAEPVRFQRSITETLTEIRRGRLLLESLYEECTGRSSE